MTCYKINGLARQQPCFGQPGREEDCRSVCTQPAREGSRSVCTQPAREGCRSVCTQPTREGCRSVCTAGQGGLQVSVYRKPGRTAGQCLQPAREDFR